MKCPYLLLFGLIFAISIGQVRYDLSDDSSIHVNVLNSADEKVRDVKVSATILDSHDQVSSSKFSIHDHSSEARFLYWDDPQIDADSYIRVTVIDKNNHKTTRYYPADIVMI